MIRVGNDQYAKENGSFGLITLRNRHVRIEGDFLKLSFRGKSGVRHEVEVKDPRVLRVVPAQGPANGLSTAEKRLVGFLGGLR